MCAKDTGREDKLCPKNDLNNSVIVEEDSKEKSIQIKFDGYMSGNYGVDKRHPMTWQIVRKDLLPHKGTSINQYNYIDTLHKPSEVKQFPQNSLDIYGTTAPLTLSYDARGNQDGSVANSNTASYSWDSEGNRKVWAKSTVIGRLAIKGGSTTSGNPTNTYKNNNDRLSKAEKLSVTQHTLDAFDDCVQVGKCQSPVTGYESNKNLNAQLSGNERRIYPSKEGGLESEDAWHSHLVKAGNQPIARVYFRKGGEPLLQYYHANNVGTVELELNGSGNLLGMHIMILMAFQLLIHIRKVVLDLYRGMDLLAKSMT